MKTTSAIAFCICVFVFLVAVVLTWPKPQPPEPKPPYSIEDFCRDHEDICTRGRLTVLTTPTPRP